MVRLAGGMGTVGWGWAGQYHCGVIWGALHHGCFEMLELWSPLHLLTWDECARPCQSSPALRTLPRTYL